MNPLDLLFGQVRNAIQSHSSADTPGPSYDSGGILGTLAGLFGQHAQDQGQQFGNGEGFASSNEDPYGDPGAQGGQQVSNNGGFASSNEDPYGDPGVQGGQEVRGGGFASSNEDPYGDPGLQR